MHQPIQKSNTNKSQGVALITVLLLTAIIAVVASKITTDKNRVINRTIKLISSDQGILSIWSIENFVKIILAKDATDSTADFPGEKWTINATIPVDNGLISGQLLDETAKYNLNNILQKGALVHDEADRVLNLFRNLEIPNPEELISAIIDYMDKDSDIYRAIPPYRGAEDGYYTTQNPPYRTANRPLFDLTEIKLVREMNREIYDKISPYLTALPQATSINANFAPKQVLMMLDTRITSITADEIIKRQNKKDAFKSYNSLIGFIQSYISDSSIGKALSAGVINVQTGYFRLNMTSNLSGTITNSTSLIKRDKETSVVVQRVFGRT